MKKLLLVYGVLIMIFMVYSYNYFSKDPYMNAWDRMDGGLRGEIDEKYVMVTFQIGNEYWKNILKGFEDAAQALNVSVEYRGSTRYDLYEMSTVLEQVIARKPAGIAISAMDAEGLNPAIHKAVEAGIPVVLFDSNAPESDAYVFLGTNNYEAGRTAGHEMGKLLGGKGEVGIITLPNQNNHQERVRGFQAVMKEYYPNIAIVSIKDGKGDKLVSKQAAEDMMRDYPELKAIFTTEATGGVGVGSAVQNYRHIKIISFDTDLGTLDLVKDGTISATLAQGTWSMGYWSLQYLFHLHHRLTQQEMAEVAANPLPPYVDTGITVVTKENVEHFYAK
ncbi:substrate-binding domain-containing protein [Marinicrinis lubricantis]|uniref:Substrate-binding domain-containing protein n=1 Tax=Marinicrinis lubricantis TaxID=2086470 RepID=A0ABW1IHV8_9BACL